MDSFYHHIVHRDGKYWVRKGSEYYTDCTTLEEALYERDRLIAVDWDWDLYLELPHTVNGYIHIDLPPFGHSASYVTYINEYWTVVSKGRNPRYYGCYHSLEDAKKVCLMYNGRITHRKGRWRVQRRIDGKNIHFGTYYNKEDALARVEELKENGWKK